MKKLLLILSTTLFCTAINAQIVTSRSVSTVSTPKESKTTWMFRVGVGSNTFSGSDYKDVGSKFGYNLGFDFNKTIKSKGAYWGMGFALGSRGYKYSESAGGYKVEETYTAHNIQWAPFNFGWKIAVTDDIKIDPHVGIYLGCDYAGKATDKVSYKGDSECEDIKLGDIEDYNRLDVGMNIGVGVWYKRFNLDLMYQKGFLATDFDLEGGASNFMVRLGVAF